ncbi:MAG: hypothetical protein ABGX07_12695, partial [Pirellulaceae bacterium]
MKKLFAQQEGDLFFDKNGQIGGFRYRIGVGDLELGRLFFQIVEFPSRLRDEKCPLEFGSMKKNASPAAVVLCA